MWNMVTLKLRMGRRQERDGIAYVPVSRMEMV